MNIMKTPPAFDSLGIKYQRTRVAHWDAVARKRDHWAGIGTWYHRRLAEICSFHISPNLRVLEIGCADGLLLATLKPAHGVGVDFSEEMVARARQRHPELEFIHTDAHDLSEITETFDIIILSDLINDLWDVQCVFEQLKHLCTSHTRIILNFYSRLWQVPLYIARKLNLATSNLYQNWLTREDVNILLLLAGFEAIRINQEILLPLPLSGLANRFLVRFWPFYHLAISNFVIARPLAEQTKRDECFSHYPCSQ